MQVFYGVATSTEIAYYTYIYAKVEPRHFQRVTAFTRYQGELIIILLPTYIKHKLCSWLRFANE